MSWVAPLKAITASKATVIAKKVGRCNANAINANSTPVSSCVVTTKNFLLLYISKKGLHKGLSVQGNIIKDVQKAICLSDTPMPLYIKVHTILSTTKGIPMAK